MVHLKSLSAALGRDAADGSIGKSIAKITCDGRIAIADIGMPRLGRPSALYRLADAAYERRSLAATSNLHPVRIQHDRVRCCGRSAATPCLHRPH